jgi:branched-chain amino acid transport system substrate-binding protein
MRILSVLSILLTVSSPEVAASFSDPFAYCQAVGNNDYREDNQHSGYIGPAVPQDVSRTMNNDSVAWRCVDGNVYGCVMGASGRACGKKNTSKIPSRDMRRYCEQSRNSSSIDNATQGDSFAEWRCSGTTPVISKIYPVDRQGYFQGSWKKVTKAESKLPAGDVRKVQETAPFLGFPLKCGDKACAFKYTKGAYTPASVNSVLDHHLTTPYTDEDGVVTAFTGEEGRGKATKLGCYAPAAKGGSKFSVAGLYGGTNDGCLPNQGLNYDSHPGYDYRATLGTEVYAAGKGKVVTAVNKVTGKSERCIPKGIDRAGCEVWGFIGIDHGNGYVTQYGHLSKIYFQSGDEVSGGDLIGLSGQSSPPVKGGAPYSVGPHLHFEVLKQSQAAPYGYAFVDPYGWEGNAGEDPLENGATGIPNVRLWKSGDGGKVEGSAPQVSPLAQSDAKGYFDGDWYSNEHGYGFRIEGVVGVATVSNSPNFKPGDQILNLDSTSGSGFRGRQLFANGRWYAVTGTLTSDGHLELAGGSQRWAMIRKNLNGVGYEQSALASRPVLTVKIGHVAPLTGPIAHLGKDNENGARLAVEDANAQKITIDGKLIQFELLGEDDQANSRTGALVARKLVNAHVAGVVGHLNSGVSISASSIYNQAGLPQISPSSTNPKYTQQGFNTAFRVMADDIQQGSVIGTYIVKEMGAQKLAIIDDRTAYGQGLADEVEKAAKANGATVVAREFTSGQAIDFKEILTKIKARNPDVIFFGGMDAVGGPMLRQMKESGVRAKFITGDGGCSPELIKLAGPASEGAICTQPGLPVDKLPNGRKFVTDFTSKYGQILVYAPYSYDAVMVLIDSMKRANSVDPAKYLPAVAKTSYNGVTGKIEFDDHGDIKNGAITVFEIRNRRLAVRDVAGLQSSRAAANVASFPALSTRAEKCTRSAGECAYGFNVWDGWERGAGAQERGDFEAAVDAFSSALAASKVISRPGDTESTTRLLREVCRVEFRRHESRTQAEISQEGADLGHVTDLGGCGNDGMHQSGVGVDADMRLHSEVALLAFLV